METTDVNCIMDYAIRMGSIKYVEYLSSEGEVCSESAIDLAAEANSLEIVEFLCSLGLKCSKYSMTLACRYANRELVKFLYTQGVGLVDAITDAFDTNSIETLKFLCSLGVKCSEYVVSLACEKGNLELVKILYSHGATVNSSAMDSAFQDDPLYGSNAHGKLEVVKFLHSLGLEFPKNALFLAKDSGNIELIEFLYSVGVQPELILSSKAVHRAVQNKDFDLMKRLINLGIYPSKTVVDDAYSKKDIDLVDFFRENLDYTKYYTSVDV